MVLRFFIIDRSKTTNNNSNLQIYKKVYPDVPIYKAFGYVFLFSISLVFFLLFYQSFQQYQFWSENEVFQYLLPPHQSINYFIFYAGTRFFGPYLISLTAAFLFLFFAKKLNKKYEERFFYPEEYHFGALAIFLTGWPGALSYSVILISLYFLTHFALFIHYKIIFRVSPREVRVSLRYLWLPTAIFVIIINRWLQDLPLWQILKI